MAATELTEKVDTYIFGVLMLELVTGRMANEAGADGHLATWAWKNFTKLMANQQEMFQSAVDRDIPDQARYMKEMATVFMLGVDCTTVDPKERPSMRMALKRLRRCRWRAPFRGLLTGFMMWRSLFFFFWKNIHACMYGPYDDSFELIWITWTVLPFSHNILLPYCVQFTYAKFRCLVSFSLCKLFLLLVLRTWTSSIWT